MNTPRIQAILFDKDGTIFDSEKIYCESWIESAKAFNVPFSAKDYDKYVGIRANECYRLAQKEFGTDFPLDDFMRHNRAFIDEQKRRGIPVKPGFISFFDKARQTGVPLGLVTSSARDAAILSFTGTDFLRHFEVFVTGDDVENAKPSPECYFLAAQRLNISPDNILVFEDSNAGVQAALEAGCNVIAIPDYLEINKKLQKKCWHLLDSFNEADFTLNHIN
ncbi:HAD family hydrolase [Catenovulum sediminis]|uniref:HAD family hydrolase n=1 Tax=Catenovulum sediminis TaxID=1740262 RepID=UPI00117C8186|nr:HAD family phosphatase [Catenovulum sediminis]